MDLHNWFQDGILAQPTGDLHGWLCGGILAQSTVDLRSRVWGDIFAHNGRFTHLREAPPFFLLQNLISPF
ncbi:hypothetical protein L6452_44584 [Arctium lappa]|uniref:Uncharacterized protein n=1 Tax=Arctium lappa TaxID=4217 RepID=A0ACB8XHX1_ARCLA|nr:hypothetical protein L6452_44584 [Arctium lappa]